MGFDIIYFDRDQNHLRNTVLHEFLHALGARDVYSRISLGGIAVQIGSFFSETVPPVILDNDQNSQKYTVVSNNAYGGSDGHSIKFGLSDIWAIQQLYGVNTETAIENDTYQADEDVIFKSIWDAGGVDTISADAFADDDAIIDLRQGHFSSIGRDDNVGIAFGAVIENAIGSDGDDVIVGNSADNEIMAGDGAVRSCSERTGCGVSFCWRRSEGRYVQKEEVASFPHGWAGPTGISSARSTPTIPTAFRARTTRAASAIPARSTCPKWA